MYELFVLMLILIFIMGGVLITWVYFLIFMLHSISKSPKLEDYIDHNRNKSYKYPKVSIILPARNEEKYLSSCIDSLLKQTYPNYEIILVNDDSYDDTLNIMNYYVEHNPNIIICTNPPRPEGWIGKNWACFNGYIKSSGTLLLFTDADSYHSENTLKIAVENMIANDLQALTLMPKLLCNDFFTKITLPILITFMHTRYSPLKVNDPHSKLGYFFGSFFIITRDTYQRIGSHQSVKHEIIEDGALGKKVKEGNYKMMMIRGENFVNAVWARNSQELIDAIDRLVVPLFKENKIKVLMLTISLFFLLLSPFVFFPYFLISYLLTFDNLNLGVSMISFIIASLITLTNIIHTKKTLFLDKIYSLGAPLGALIIVSGFIKGISKSNRDGLVSWRGRKYLISSDQSPL